MKHIKILGVAFLFAMSINSLAQDTVAIIDIPDEETTTVGGTFLSHRLFNGQSCEMLEKGEVKFMVNHRMGKISSGADNLFGIYQATSRIGFDYGLLDRVTIGVGSSNVQNMFDGYAKVKIITQSSGTKNTPISLAWHSNIMSSKKTNTYTDGKSPFSRKLAFTHQLIISRKFCSHFSLQVSPTLLHRNIVQAKGDKNTVALIGTAFSLKVTNKTRLTFEHYYILPNQIESTISNNKVRNTVCLGAEIKSGPRHVFQVFVSNTAAIQERSYLVENTDKFNFDNLRIGFNIPTTFFVR